MNKELKKQYIVSERAHLMCPNMFFGVKFRLDAGFAPEKLANALELLACAHPFLRSVIAGDESGRLYYAFDDARKLEYTVGENASNWQKEYRALTANGWDAFDDGLLKVVAYPSEAGLELLLIAHHLLADGRGLLGLACELADLYAGGVKPAFVQERLIATPDDLPAGSGLPFVSRLVVNSANRTFAKENKTVSYSEYLAFERRFIRENPLSFEEETLEAPEVERLLALCRGEGISLNDYLVAEMMCREGCGKVVIAADIRKLLACYNEGALGNYATAMGIECKSGANVLERARAVSQKIKQMRGDNKKLMLVLACYFAMLPGLIDAVAISTLGDFASKAGRFVGTAMFGYEKRDGHSVTNLGSIKNANMREAMFIPPASPANAKTMGVVTVNSCMKKCTVSYESAR